MPRITFKAKVRTMYNMDDTVAYQYIHVPEFTRSHCDMNEFRKYDKFHANSDLFPVILRRIKLDAFGGRHLRLDAVPPSVSVDTSKFLAVVTVEVA